ncbi:hypothetical protein K2173_028467 [Erythroxylum novogranatense]|uniref:Uncharacterized protein n=1 Tax=Erythroxylum novogranatense TaxID=1862640 RepID=A0AAV8U233_9ROSI|nr:hypothetical protein K2173_028467 [Erythroxylum novogranatense]
MAKNTRQKEITSDLQNLQEHVTKSEEASTIRRERMEVLLEKVEGVSEDVLKDCFTSGLKTNVRLEVVSRNPSTLLEAATLAHSYDEKFKVFPQSVLGRTKVSSAPASALKHIGSTTSSSMSTTATPTTGKILLDGGSSDNVIQPRHVKHLQILVDTTANFKVIVENGQRMQCEGFIKEIPVTICGHLLVFPIFVLPIVGSDIVIGSDWLETFGSQIVDYKTSRLKFHDDNSFITLQGYKAARAKPA